MILLVITWFPIGLSAANPNLTVTLPGGATMEFANGVVAEFNMGTNQFRVMGVTGFCEEWGSPDLL
jgi:hypothetical protein